MRAHLHHLRRDERGMSLVFVSVAFMALLSATTLAIDVGMFMNSRSQAQNAADAGALAGAVALVYNDYDDRSATGPAVQSAINTARTNVVIGVAPSVTPPDVTFPKSPAGLNNRVRVEVLRTASRPDPGPVPTLIGGLFGVKTVDITAVAVAEASPATAETCVKPFTIPDKWIENQDKGGWTPDSTFDTLDAKGKALPNPDVYIPPWNPDTKQSNPDYTGYNMQRDKGVEIVLKADNNTKITASFYNPWDLPGSSGASDYRANIAGCNSAVLAPGEKMSPEPGNMVGPTAQGMADRIALDPGARWEGGPGLSGCNCVQGSKYSQSPRVAIIPVYDPVAFADGKQHGKGITLINRGYIGVFIEDMKGSDVYGRITPIIGVDGGDGTAPAGAFPKLIRLVQ